MKSKRETEAATFQRVMVQFLAWAYDSAAPSVTEMAEQFDLLLRDEDASENLRKFVTLALLEIIRRNVTNDELRAELVEEAADALGYHVIEARTN